MQGIDIFDMKPLPSDRRGTYIIQPQQPVLNTNVQTQEHLKTQSWSAVQVMNSNADVPAHQLIRIMSDGLLYVCPSTLAGFPVSSFLTDNHIQGLTQTSLRALRRMWIRLQTRLHRTSGRPTRSPSPRILRGTKDDGGFC